MHSKFVEAVESNDSALLAELNDSELLFEKNTKGENLVHIAARKKLFMVTGIN